MRFPTLFFRFLSVLAICAHFGCTNDPKTEDVLRIRTDAEATILNPYMPSPGYSRYVSAQIFQTLAAVDPVTFEMQPVLITKIPEVYSVKDGPFQGKFAYDFEFRPEAKWDNDVPITAQDLIFTLKLILNPYLPTQPWRGYFESLQDVVIDPQNPKKCTAYFSSYYILALESMCQVPILPAYNYDPQNDISKVALTQLITKIGLDTTALQRQATVFASPQYSTDPTKITGSGPYQVGNIQPGESMQLVRKTKYWADALSNLPSMGAFPKKIVYRFVKDEAAVENLMLNQEIDLGFISNAQKFLDMQKDPAITINYELKTQSTFQYSYWMLNQRNPLLQDKNIRQALAQLVPYEKVQQEIYQNMAVRTIGAINPSKSYYHKDLAPYQHNVKAVSTLLDSLGWKVNPRDGIREHMIQGKKTRFSIVLLTSGASVTSTRLAESIKDEARKAGVEIVIEAADINVITQRTRAGDFQSAILAAATIPGPDDLYQNFHSNSFAPKGDNRSGYASPFADSLIQSIRSNPDLASRKQEYIKLQAIIHADAPHIFLFVPQQRYFVHKRYEPVMTPNRPGYMEGLFRVR
jgi:ABC-type transport system substrate-binding protein